MASDANTGDTSASNTSKDFEGLPEIKRHQAETTRVLKAYAAAGRWRNIHSAHYNWWMFPINERSSMGFKWTVYDAEVQQLRADPVFMDSFMEGVREVALSWGWDVDAAAEVPVPATEADQRWQGWGVRLYKMTRSLKLLAPSSPELASMHKYGSILLSRGHEIRYNRKNLAWIFELDVNAPLPPGVGMR